jgi:hypothetical protein
VLPPKLSKVELLRSLRADNGSALVVHPSGRLEITQRVVPLSVTLDKVGNAPVSTYDRFRIEEVLVGGTVIETEPAKEYFARGQFESLSKHERLSAPAFEKMTAGVRAVSAVVKITGAIVDAPVTYDSILFNSDSTATAQTSQGATDADAASATRAATGKRRAAMRRGREGRFAEAHVPGKVDMRDEMYCVAARDTLRRATLDATHETPNETLTRMDAERLLADEVLLHPDRGSALMVLPEYELEAA